MKFIKKLKALWGAPMEQVTLNTWTNALIACDELQWLKPELPSEDIAEIKQKVHNAFVRWKSAPDSYAKWMDGRRALHVIGIVDQVRRDAKQTQMVKP